MNAARALRWARRGAGLSQRALSRHTGVPQSTIGRIEAGKADPRVGTLLRLLRACGYGLEVQPALGEGIDRSLIGEMLALRPSDRVERLAVEARFLAALDTARRRYHASTA